MGIRAIILDNDGVLIDTEGTAVIHDLPFLKKFGIAYSVPEYAALMSGKSLKDFMAILNQDCVNQTGSPLPADFLDQLRALHAEQVDTIVPAVPGAISLVNAFAQAGMLMAVASNGEEKSLRHKLERIGLYNRLMPHVYNKDHVGGAGKPAPDLFLHAMHALGVDNPKDCIAIGDSVFDMVAGRAAGMFTIGYSGGAHRASDYGDVLYAAGADKVFETMAEMEAFTMGMIRPAPSPALPHPQP